MLYFIVGGNNMCFKLGSFFLYIPSRNAFYLHKVPWISHIQTWAWVTGKDSCECWHSHMTIQCLVNTVS